MQKGLTINLHVNRKICHASQQRNKTVQNETVCTIRKRVHKRPLEHHCEILGPKKPGNPFTSGPFLVKKDL